MKKKIFLIGTVIFIILICIAMYVFNKTVLNNEVRDTNIIESSVEKETTEVKPTRKRYSSVFACYFDYKETGNWFWLGPEVLDYFTDNFKNTYSNSFDLYSDVRNSKGAWTSFAEDLNDKGDKIRIEYTWKVENDKKKMSRVDYDLTLTDDGKIDDCKITNVIYYDPVTYNPLDGRPITLEEYLIADYIQVLWRYSYSIYDSESPSYYRELVDIPKSENCQIINLPEEPNECEGSLPYYKAIYGKNKLSDDFEVIGIDISSIKYYKVEYDINDKAQFTRIEFKEITEDEYNEGRKN